MIVYENDFSYTILFWTAKSMYSKISRKITSCLIDLGIIDNNDFEIYEYGFEVILSFLFSILIINVFSFILNRFVETLLYLIGFFSVRAVCGGYHAKHHYSCFGITISTYFFFLFFQHYLSSKHYLNQFVIFIIIVSFIIILVFSPVEHPNNPMTEFRKRRNRIYSIVLSFVLCVVLGISLLNNRILTVIYSYALGTFFASLAILAAKIDLIIQKRKES